MVNGGKSTVRSSHFAASVTEALESLLQSMSALHFRMHVPALALLVMSLRERDACLQVFSKKKS